MNEIYYNTPCELYRGFLESDRSMRDCLNNVSDYAIMKAYEKHHGNNRNLKEIALKCCGIIIGSESTVKKIGTKLIREYEYDPVYAPAYFSIRKDIFWHFHDEQTTDDDRAVLLAYLALRSMIGNREMMRTNTDFLLSRMAGNTKYVPVGELHSSIQHYGGRYQRSKLQNLLYERHGISFYSGTKGHTMRGFYFSTTLSVEDLIKRVEDSKREAAQRPKDPLKEARQAALAKLGIIPPNSS